MVIPTVGVALGVDVSVGVFVAVGVGVAGNCNTNGNGMRSLVRPSASTARSVNEYVVSAASSIVIVHCDSSSGRASAMI